MVIDLTGFDIKDIPRSMMKSMPKMFDMSFRKYVLPIMKGEGKMGKKKSDNGWPEFPMWDPSEWDWADWDGNKEKAKAKAKDFRNDFQSFWEKGIDWQKSAIDNSKDQYEQFFASMQDAMDSFAEFLPEEMPWMPPCFASPKSFRKTMKEWENMANDYFKQQADTLSDFAIKSQEKACEDLPEVPEKAEEKEVVAEAKVVEAKSDTATKKAAPAKKAEPVKKAEPAKKDEPAKDAK